MGSGLSLTMLFARRKKLDFFQRLKAWMWPKNGWKRAASYVWRRVWRLKGTPHIIALGFAAGVFASFTPFIGFHFFIGFALAWALGGNLIASALGTFVGNPVTFPFIWWFTLSVGNRILGNKTIEFDWDWARLFSDSYSNIWMIIKPMIIAGVPTGIAAAVLSYFLIHPAIEAYQARRPQKPKNTQVM